MKLAAAKKMLTEKEPPRLFDLIEPALEDTELRAVLVDGSADKNETVRYNCVRVLLRAMGREPQLFYPYWDRFAAMIASPNGFHRSSAAQAIAYLSQVDVDCRLDGVLNRYLGLLDDSKVMVTHYFVETLDTIYRARPDLRKRIFSSLLSIERTQHPPQRKDLVKADILGVFDTLFDILPAQDRKKALAFAKGALEARSPKTRKAARAFAAKYSR